MPDSLNLVPNPRLTQGAQRPRGWQWSADRDDIRWARGDAVDGCAPGIVIISTTEKGTGVWTRRVRCKAKHWYRIEAVVACDCSGDDKRAGATLGVRPVAGREPTGGPVHLASVLRTIGPVTLRSYYRAPEGTTSLEVRIGLRLARGSMQLHSVLVIPNVEPEVTSHALALPPPPYAYPAPWSVHRLCVCGDTDEGGPLVAMLEKRYGARNVDYHRSRRLQPHSLRTDALIITGSTAPAGLRSLSALTRFAGERLVVVSLEAFTRIVGRGLSVRTIEQPDDPLCAEVHWANFITRGLALKDVFPWASTARDTRVFRQRHLRKGAPLKELRRRFGFETMLVSVTDTDATSGHPVCLYRAIPGGGIIVCDTDLIETIPSTADEPNIAAFLLLNMLGADQTSLGQYIVPVETQKDWYALLREFVDRYPMFELTGRDPHDRMIELGVGRDWPGPSPGGRPLLLVRTGLHGDDLAGIYGTMVYLKQLVRPGPYRNPYARSLLGRYRLAWIPLCAAWQGRHWNEALAGQSCGKDLSFEEEEVGAVIDLTASPSHDLRILYAREEPAFARHAVQLSGLGASFSAGRYFYRAVVAGHAAGRRDTMSWRKESLIPSLAVDPTPFDTEFHHEAASRGAELIRIEIPDSNSDFICNSIWRTDLAATTLEHVIGSQYGMLAMNRRCKSVTHGGYSPLKPGEAIEIDARKNRVLRAMRAV